VLRSRDRAGAEQEVRALLAVYQALRMAMTPPPPELSPEPTRTGPASPSRSKPHESRSPPRAASKHPQSPVTPAGSAAPSSPACCPPGGHATAPGRFKCSTSRFHVTDQDRPELPTTITRVLVTILAPPPDRPAARPRSQGGHSPVPGQPRPDTRREKVTRIMASQPGRDWAGHDLADMLGIKPRNMLTQLAEWTRWGFLVKTGKGRYALPEPVSGLVTALASP
jgi:hypothetical protein